MPECPYRSIPREKLIDKIQGLWSVITEHELLACKHQREMAILNLKVQDLEDRLNWREKLGSALAEGVMWALSLKMPKPSCLPYPRPRKRLTDNILDMSTEAENAMRDMSATMDDMFSTLEDVRDTLGGGADSTTRVVGPSITGVLRGVIRKTS